MSDPLLAKLDEILKRHLTLDLKQQSVISFNVRVIRLEGELRALMADVAIDEHCNAYLRTHGVTPDLFAPGEIEYRKAIRQRFGVGAEEKA